MATALADLLVRMDVDSAKMRSELENLGGKFDALGEKVEKAGKKTADAFKAMEALKAIYALGKGVAEFVAQSAEAADKMGKMAQAAGVSVAEFSRLAWAAQLNGVAADDLSGALQRLAGGIEKAAAGGTGATQAFAAMGIALKSPNGELRSSVDVLKDIAIRFASYEDGTGKAALAQELFGKSGAKLIPLLNQGASGIAMLAAEADRLGITLTDKGAASASKFGDSLAKLKALLSGVGNAAAADLGESLDRLTASVTNNEAAMNGLKDAGSVIASVFKVIGTVGVELYGIFRLITQGVADLLTVAVAFQFKGPSAALDWLKKTGADAKDNTRAMLEQVRAIWIDDSEKIAGIAPSVGQKIAAPLVSASEEIAKAAERAKQEAERAGESLRKTIEGYYSRAFEEAEKSERGRLDFKMAFGDIAEQLKALPADVAEEYRRGLSAAAAYFDRIHSGAERAKKAEQGWADKVREAKRALEEIQTPLEKWNEKQRLYNDLLARRIITQEQADRLNAAAAEEFTKTDPGYANAAKDLATLDEALAKRNEREARYRLELEATAITQEQYDALMAKSAEQFIADSEPFKAAAEWREKHASASQRAAEAEAKFAAMVNAGAADEAEAARWLAEVNRELKEADPLYRDAQRRLEEMKPPAQKYREELALLQRELKNGFLTQQEHAAAVAKATAEFEKSADKMNADAQRLADGLQSTLADQLASGFSEGLDGMLASFGRFIARMLAQAAAANILGALGFGPGGWASKAIGSLLGTVGGAATGGGGEATPARAEGGPVSAASAYLVGERGPELFIPAQSGSIVSHEQTAAAAGGTRAAPSVLKVQLDDKALGMTLRDWLEGELATLAATR